MIHREVQLWLLSPYDCFSKNWFEANCGKEIGSPKDSKKKNSEDATIIGTDLLAWL